MGKTGNFEMMMELMKKQYWGTELLVLVALALAFLSCKGPTDSAGEKVKVITLIDREYLQGGRYGIFWDGKNSKKEYIAPGTYLYQLEAPGFIRAKRMTAIAGGKTEENLKYAYFEVEPGVWATFELGDSEPEPFQIQAGVVIPIQVKGEWTQITLTIFKD